VAGVLVLCLAGGIIVVLSVANSAKQIAGPAHVVVEVTGSGPATVNLLVDGSRVLNGPKNPPYTYTSDLDRGSYVSITVQPAQPGGSATCRITVNGTVESTHTASGFSQTATCDAFI
jgi:hypothetical protein